MAISPHRLALLGSGDDDTTRVIHNSLEVPSVEQETDYSCGAAALLAVLRFHGLAEDVVEAELYGELETTPEHGTAPDDIVRLANAYGLTANWRTGVKVDDLRAAFRARVPVILDVQAWDEEPDAPEEHNSDGHYVVLVAVDDKQVEYMDPSYGDYASMSIEELDERWHDVEGERGAIFIEGAANG